MMARGMMCESPPSSSVSAEWSTEYRGRTPDSLLGAGSGFTGAITAAPSRLALRAEAMICSAPSSPLKPPTAQDVMDSRSRREPRRSDLRAPRASRGLAEAPLPDSPLMEAAAAASRAADGAGGAKVPAAGRGAAAEAVVMFMLDLRNSRARGSATTKLFRAD